jgi:hypothetical protein
MSGRADHARAEIDEPEVVAAGLGDTILGNVVEVDASRLAVASEDHAVTAETAIDVVRPGTGRQVVVTVAADDLVIAWAAGECGRCLRARRRCRFRRRRG